MGRTRRVNRTFGILVLAGLVAITAHWATGGDEGDTTADPPVVESATLLSEVYTIDRKYRSMMGPYSQREVRLGDVDEPELVWIVGYEATMVDATGEEAMPQDFMCHSNLDIDVQSHHVLVGSNPGYSSRLFTLSQGQLSIRFPAGFGIPVLSSEPLGLTTQVLNLNHEGESLGVRHRVTIDYVRDAQVDGQVDGQMKALFPSSAYGLALIEGKDGYYGIRRPDDETHGPGCMVGENASPHEYEDGMGRTFTGHWVVKPGREENRTLVTRLMNLPFDTEIHYIAVHLHPFAESLELRDLTTDTILFRSKAENFDGKIGLLRVDHFTSQEGVPVYRDHEYELVSVYSNTTDEDQDSMAVMYLYLRDHEFDRQRVDRALRRR